MTVVFVVWGVFFAIWVCGRGESIYTLIQTMLSLFQGPSLAIILLGVLWWRATGKGALVGLIGGILMSTSLLTVDNFQNPALTAQDLKNPAGLVNKLNHPNDPVSTYLNEKLSEDSKQTLDLYEQSLLMNEKAPEGLRENLNEPIEMVQAEIEAAILGDINGLMGEENFYEEQRFSQIELDPEIQKYIQQNPKRKKLLQLNRLLLERAYPDEIEKNPHVLRPLLFQTEDPFLFIAWWSFCFAMLLTVVISLLTKPEPEEKLKGLVYRYRKESE